MYKQNQNRGWGPNKDMFRNLAENLRHQKAEIVHYDSTEWNEMKGREKYGMKGRDRQTHTFEDGVEGRGDWVEHNLDPRRSCRRDQGGARQLRQSTAKQDGDWKVGH